MRRITMLAGAVLAIGGCKGPEYGLGTGSGGCFMDTPCSGGGYYGPIIVRTIIGFPSARVDTAGPRTPEGYYYGRMAVGDSVVLYLVQHDARDDACAAPDTLRTVTWGSYDTTVLRARTEANGRGVVRAGATGETMVNAIDAAAGASTTSWTCEGGKSAHYFARIRVDPKSP
jgi:hypothetical protein